MKLSTLCLVLSAVALRVHSQIMFTDERTSLSGGSAVIGNCSVPDQSTITELVGLTYTPADGNRDDFPTVVYEDHVFVCQAPGLTRGTVGAFSAIVTYSCTGGTGAAAASACTGASRIDQFQFDCNEDNTFSRAVITAGAQRTEDVSVIDPPDQQCGLCVASDGFIPTDAVTHCVDCPSSCDEGQRMCVNGDFADPGSTRFCCNWYLEGRCVVECPGALTGDTDGYDCGCGELELDNGAIEYTNRFAVNSVATHSCDEDLGYLRSGNSNQRTCELPEDATEAGWSGSPITCELHTCDASEIQRPENGNLVNFPGSAFGQVVTFSCVDKYLLVGDESRTCTLSGWTGSNPTCVDQDDKTTESTGETDKSSSACNTACIIGIVVAVVVVLILSALLAGVIYAIYSYVSNPDTKLAKLDPNGINGVARDNPLYVDPDAVVGAEATDAVVGAEAA